MSKNNKKPKKQEKKDVLDEIIEEINALDDNTPAEGGQPEEPAQNDNLEFDYGFLDKKKSKKDKAPSEGERMRDKIPYDPSNGEPDSGDSADAPSVSPAPVSASQQEGQSPAGQPVMNQTAPSQPYPPQYGYPAMNGAPPPYRKKKHKKKKRRSRLPGVLILTTLIFGVSIVLSMVIIGYGRDMLGIGKSETNHLITIPEGASTERISEMLEEEGIIKSPKAFQLFSRLRQSDTEYIAGEHFVRPNMAYEAIINELTHVQEEAEGETMEITFPEGITILDAANILESNGICKADDFIFFFNAGGLGYDFENLLPKDTSLKYYRMEGYLFPDTYFFTQGMDVDQICRKIYNNFNNKMTEDRLDKMKQLGLSLDELITFASVVQKEAATTGAMEEVAAVFWNRLNNPDIFPLLQSDPTSNYAKDIVAKHMEVYDQTFVDSYDTYVTPGLPSGPICNPGIEAIDAVLANKPSDYFYFYANLHTGMTYFSETLEQHEEKIAMVEEQYEQEEADKKAEEAAAAAGGN
ncbi:MAG TPA: endolytic transglycosylase MltG [Ruminococcus sp.]|nr:endolytic transglycosylase MltG [Ruminococcus sp.]